MKHKLQANYITIRDQSRGGTRRVQRSPSSLPSLLISMCLEAFWRIDWLTFKTLCHFLIKTWDGAKITIQRKSDVKTPQCRQ